jgi:hypothetical protein
MMNQLRSVLGDRTMVGTYRSTIVRALAAWLMCAPLAGPLIAQERTTTAATPGVSFSMNDCARVPATCAALSIGTFANTEKDQRAAFVQYRGRRGGRRNESSAAAIALGAVGVIAGTAVLVYANRPECNANPQLSGCGYGTKVVGGAVLSAGLVGVMVGALTWR